MFFNKYKKIKKQLCQDILHASEFTRNSNRYVIKLHHNHISMGTQRFNYILHQSRLRPFLVEHHSDR